jgi:quinoprotein glucose dehydrogenase
MSIDEKRAMVFLATGSPTYDFYGADRKGENLFGNCIVALDAKTGKHIWHFQTVIMTCGTMIFPPRPISLL